MAVMLFAVVALLMVSSPCRLLLLHFRVETRHAYAERPRGERRGGKAQGEGYLPSLERKRSWRGKDERSEGLHKRSAEDCGTPLAPRQGGALSEVGCRIAALKAARPNLIIPSAARGGLASETQQVEILQRRLFSLASVASPWNVRNDREAEVTVLDPYPLVC
jgi:hypothetical protein